MSIRCSSPGERVNFLSLDYSVLKSQQVFWAHYRKLCILDYTEQNVPMLVENDREFTVNLRFQGHREHDKVKKLTFVQNVTEKYLAEGV